MKRPCGRLLACAIAVSLVLVGALHGLAGPALNVRAQNPRPLPVQGDTQVVLDPPDVELDVGVTTVVSIRIEDVTNLYRAELVLSFDPAVLEVVDADPEIAGVQIEPGPFLGADTTEENIVFPDEGEVDFSQVVPGESVNGSGVLARITVRGKAGGTSALVFDDVLLEDEEGGLISVDVQNGSVKVTGEETPMPTAEPSETPVPPPEDGATSTPTPTPGATASATLNPTPTSSPSPQPAPAAGSRDLRVMQVWPDRSVGVLSELLEGSAAYTDIDILPLGVSRRSTGDVVRGRTYLYFPLDVFPPGTDILRAVLYVYVDSASRAGEATFGMYRVLETWGEEDWGRDPASWPVLLTPPIWIEEVGFDVATATLPISPPVPTATFTTTPAATPALTEGDTQVVLDPPDVEVDVGATTVVSIRIEDVTDLHSAELALSFDPAALEVVDADPEMAGVQIEPGPFLGADATEENVVYPDEGKIEFYQVVRGELVSDGGVVARITVRGKAGGTSTLVFDDILLEDEGGEPISVDVRDGSVTVVGEETPTPGPGATSTAPASPLPTPTPSPTGSATLSATPSPARPTTPVTLTQVPAAWVKWDVTALMRAWLAGEVPNDGLALASAPSPDVDPETAGDLLVARWFAADDLETAPYLIVEIEVLPVTPTPLPTATPPPSPLLPPAGRSTGPSGWGVAGVLLVGAALVVVGLIARRQWH